MNIVKVSRVFEDDVNLTCVFFNFFFHDASDWGKLRFSAPFYARRKIAHAAHYNSRNKNDVPAHVLNKMQRTSSGRPIAVTQISELRFYLIIELTIRE